MDSFEKPLFANIYTETRIFPAEQSSHILCFFEFHGKPARIIEHLFRFAMVVAKHREIFFEKVVYLFPSLFLLRFSRGFRFKRSCALRTASERSEKRAEKPPFR